MQTDRSCTSNSPRAPDDPAASGRDLSLVGVHLGPPSSPPESEGVHQRPLSIGLVALRPTPWVAVSMSSCAGLLCRATDPALGGWRGAGAMSAVESFAGPRVELAR